MATLTKKQKRAIALEKVKAVTHTLLGVEPELITEEKVFRKDLGMDDIYSIRFMMLCEEAFNHEINDKFFVRNPDIPDKDMWQFKTVGELLDFYVETIKIKKEDAEAK